MPRKFLGATATAANELIVKSQLDAATYAFTCDDTAPTPVRYGHVWIQPASGVCSVWVPTTDTFGAWVVPIGQQGSDGGTGPPGANGTTPTPGGSTGNVQYNNAGAWGGASKVQIVGGNLKIDDDAVPASALAASVPYSRKFGGRSMMNVISPTGAPYPLQPHGGKVAISQWEAAGNSTTVTAFGNAALAGTGTATAANVATTNRHTYMKRVQYLVTTAATTAVAGFRTAAAQWAIGGAAGDGGFHFVCRYGPATGVATTTHRCFVGMRSGNSVPTDVEPSSLTNMCGFGYDAADTNIQFMRNDGSGTATKVDLGSDFPVPTADRTKAYECGMFVAPNGTEIFYEFRDLATGNVATGSVTTDLPVNTTLLGAVGYMSAGGTSSVIGIALMNLYIETDF